MKKMLSLVTVVVALALAPGMKAFAAQFTAGNIVVYRIGDGSATLTNSGNAVFLDEYTTNNPATLVQSFMMPTNYFGAYSPLIGSGTAFGSGLITLSVDGRFILVNGYGATLGQFTNSGVQGNFASSVPRVTALVDGQGNTDTTTVQTNSARNSVELRSATSPDGTNIWTGGDGGGIRYQTWGSASSEPVETSNGNTRQLNIFNNQLYYDVNNPASLTQSIFVVSNTLASTLPVATNGVTNVVLSAVTTPSPEGFFMTKLGGGPEPIDTLYVANALASGGNVEKYSLSGSTWVNNGAVGGINNCIGLTGVKSGGNVVLYITQGGTTLTGGNNIGRFTDTTGFNAAPDGSDLALIVNGVTKKAFRGIVMAPTTNSALALPSGAGRLSVGPAIDVFAKSYTGCNNTNETNVYSLANPGTSSIGWTATVNAAWVNFSSVAGTLTSLGSATLTVTLGDLTGLTNPTNSALITFSNTTSSVGTTTRAVTLFLSPQEVSPASDYNITGQPGGPFSPTNRNYTVQNGSTAFTLAVSKSASWLNLSATSVSVGSCTSAVISVSINTNAANLLAAGIYTDVVSFTNATASTLLETRAVNLTVGGVFFCDDFSTFTQNTAIEGQQGWAAYNANPSILVSNGAVYQPASGTALDEPYKNLPQMSNNVEFVYYALSMMYTSAPPFNVSPVFGPTLYRQQNASSNFRNELSARASDAGNTQFVFGARLNNCGPWVFGTTPFNYNTPYNVIVRSAVSSSNQVVWVNPGATENVDAAYISVTNAGTYCFNNDVGSFQFGGQFTTSTTPSPGYAVYKVCISTNYADAYNDLQPSSPPLTPFQTWQTNYFGTTNNLNAAGNADPDGDGLSNTNEFLAGFNPTNSAAFLKIISIVRTDGTNNTITYLGASGDSTYSGGPASRTNVLESTLGTPPSYTSTNFVSTGQTNILSSGTGLGTSATFVDTNGVSNPAKYYRVRVLVP